MDFYFPLNELFPTEISIVDENLVPRNSPGIKKLGLSVVKSRTMHILDVMGTASSDAQNLNHIITSAQSLRVNAGQGRVVYFLLKFDSNQVVGFLKVGRKKLFVYDLAGVLHEISPMCVLDFYIHEQDEAHRRFDGAKGLFETMLKNEGIRVEHLAMGCPSDELNDFFRKHYGLVNLIPQVNNFAIFDGFFDERTDYSGAKPRWAGLDSPPCRIFHPHCAAAASTGLQDNNSSNTTTPALNLKTDTNNIRGTSSFEFGNPPVPCYPDPNEETLSKIDYN